MEPPLHLKLSSLSVISQKKLEGILSQCGDKKDLIIDPALIKPFEKVCGVSWLRQRGVDKIYKMDPQLTTGNDNKLYLIPSSTLKYKCVLDHITSILGQNESLSDKNCFHIVIVPKAFSRFEMALESRGLYGIVKLYSFSWELMLLDEGILSLEIPFLYKNVFVDQDQSLLSSISMSLWSLFHVIGKPKVSFAVGKMSTSVIDILQVYNDTFSTENIAEPTQEVGALVVIDRSQDYASGLLTPATYSGLLSELFTVRSGQLELNVKNTKLKEGKIDFKLKEPESEEKVSTMMLNSSVDSLWREVKYRHFSEVFAVLSTKAKALKQSNVKELGIKEMKHFVSTQLQQVTEEKRKLVNHVMACETIISEMKNSFETLKSTEADMINDRNKKSNFNFVDEHFGTDIHIHNSLRLMCLLSLTQGITSDEYNTLLTKYLHAFGHQYLYIFSNLASAGLLVQPSSSKLPLQIPKTLGNISERLPKWQSNFYAAASKLKQLPTEEVSKTCPSYVFHGGYIPLISVICNSVLTCENFQELMTKLSTLNDLRIGGQFLEKIKAGMETLEEKLSSLNLQELELDYGSRQAKILMNLLKGSPNLGDIFPLKPRCVLVYVIGGVTYAEIAACDIIQRTTGSTVIVASDSVIAGSDLMKANF